ncbi:ComF family protein [Streptacidiphilus sp. EB129]|uniref:ComF family protein n=1 Tax=Streptacidiphilus sp. EB129 TaxID=3156262 RepID=UPI003516FBEF
MTSLSVQLFDAALDLLVPARCVGCQAPHTQLCALCRADLEDARPAPARPRAAPPGLPEVFAAVHYEGAARQVLLAHKERGALRLARPLGLALAGAVTAAVPGSAASRAAPLLLVPMPSTRATVRARGHDPTRRLTLAATGALRRAGIPARLLPALRHGRAVADQSDLGAAERLRNLHGALTVRSRHRAQLGHGRIILVDDLVTTGATLAEGARALAAAGGDVLAAAVVAATVLRARTDRSGAHLPAPEESPADRPPGGAPPPDRPASARAQPG